MESMLKKCVLTLTLVFGMAAATEPEVSFSGPARLGQLKLEPGLYKLKLIGTVAMFTSAATGKSYSTVTRAEKSSQRSTFTAVMGATEDGVQRVEIIIIAGSEYRLNFK
jgi:hypothetical protein